MVNKFRPGMATTELIKARTQQLLQLPEDVAKAWKILQQSRFWSKEAFKNKYARRIQREAYKPDALVLIRNNPIENSVSIGPKTANRYMGPYRIVCQTEGGSYILAEMDGSLLQHHVATFRLIPYIQWEDLNPLAEQIGISGESEVECISDASEVADQSDHSLTNLDNSDGE